MPLAEPDASWAPNFSVGLRLVFFLGLPASMGLVLLSNRWPTLFFHHGEVTAADAARLSHMIACYGLGVWAFCARRSWCAAILPRATSARRFGWPGWRWASTCC